jgi:hypothetical protein
VNMASLSVEPFVEPGSCLAGDICIRATLGRASSRRSGVNQSGWWIALQEVSPGPGEQGLARLALPRG